MGFNLANIDNGLDMKLSYDKGVLVESYFVNILNESIEIEDKYTKIKERLYCNISDNSIPLDESLNDYLHDLKDVLIDQRNKIVDLSDEYAEESKKQTIPSGFDLELAKKNIGRLNIVTKVDYRFHEGIPTLYAIGDKHGDKFFKDLTRIEGILRSPDSVSIKQYKIQGLIDNIYTIDNISYNNSCPEYWNRIRAKIIHTNEPIGSDMYTEKLYGTYRTKADRMANENDVQSAYDNLKDNKLVRQVLDNKKEVMKNYDKLLDGYNSIKLSKYIRYGGINDNDVALLDSLLTQFIIRKTDQLNKISSLHRLAFAAKLDAMKEQRTSQFELINALDMLNKGGK